MSAAGRLFACGVLLGGLTWAEPAPELAKASPFLAPGKAARPTLPPDPLHLDGTSAAAGRTLVCVFDARVRQSYWIPIGETQGGITALGFDAASQTAVVAVKGVKRTLALKEAPGGPSERDAAKVQRQQAEARMLVSDLLDIGMQQRKAREKADSPAPKPEPKP